MVDVIFGAQPYKGDSADAVISLPLVQKIRQANG
jgi:hypothetical protein